MSKRLVSERRCAEEGCPNAMRMHDGKHCAMHAYRIRTWGSPDIVHTRGVRVGTVPIHDKLMAVLDDTPRTALELAALIGAQRRSVYKALTHMIGREADRTGGGHNMRWTKRNDTRG